MVYQVNLKDIKSVDQMELVLNEVEELANKLEIVYNKLTGNAAFENDVLTNNAVKYAINNSDSLFKNLSIQYDNFGRIELV